MSTKPELCLTPTRSPPPLVESLSALKTPTRCALNSPLELNTLSKLRFSLEDVDSEHLQVASRVESTLLIPLRRFKKLPPRCLEITSSPSNLDPLDSPAVPSTPLRSLELNLNTIFLLLLIELLNAPLSSTQLLEV